MKKNCSFLLLIDWELAIHLLYVSVGFIFLFFCLNVTNEEKLSLPVVFKKLMAYLRPDAELLEILKFVNFDSLFLDLLHDCITCFIISLSLQVSLKYACL